ncbi:MAG: FtsX-like permease family protein [Pseudomonadota bacterium]
MTLTSPNTNPRTARTTPLLPEAGAAGTPLTIVIAVLAFMASVALAGYFMVSRAVHDWTGDLSGTITVQIKGANTEFIERDAVRAIEILQAADGVSSVTRLRRDETEALLAPWLGTDNLGPEIPIPALVTANVTPERRTDLASLRELLETRAPGASLDDHSLWNDRLVGAARRGQAVAFVVFSMVLGASAAVIIFATRAGLAANKDIVEVMHLVGATNRFIADEVQKRYLSLGLRGGGIGALLAALVLFLSASVNQEEQGLFLPNLSADPVMLLWLVLIPIILCGVASVTARLTVMRALQEQM